MTSSDIVRAYKVEANNDAEQIVTPIFELNNNSEYHGPISSFDWNTRDVNQIATASIDTTVSIIDIIQKQLIT